MSAAVKLAKQLAKMTPEKRTAIYHEMPYQHVRQLEKVLRYSWEVQARPKQLEPPGKWRFWLAMAGRGWGKTRTGAEWIRGLAESGRYKWLTMIGPTREAVFKVMIKGPAGLLTISPDWAMPKHVPSRTMIVYPNGTQVRYYSAERPERLRGEQHEAVWMDEVGAWPRPEAFDQIDMGLRLGVWPRALITTTPKPSKLIVDLALGPMNKEGKRIPRKDVVVVKGFSDENSQNLSEGYVESLLSRYGDTRLGRQEIYAELLEKTGKELWREDVIEATRVPGIPVGVHLKLIVIAVDPTRADMPGDECGIVAVALGSDGDAYVLEDATVKGSPFIWATRALEIYGKLRADRLTYEKTGMGEEIKQTIRSIDPTAKWVAVDAREGKMIRAAPVSALYEQGKVHHVGTFPILEDEMVTWDPETSASPNRMDALVWGITDVLLGDIKTPWIVR